MTVTPLKKISAVSVFFGIIIIIAIVLISLIHTLHFFELNVIFIELLKLKIKLSLFGIENLNYYEWF